MGAYINVKNQPKEDWLKEKGTEISLGDALKWTDFEVNFLVVLVDNGPFTAAGVAYDRREKDGWLQPDPRPRSFYSVKKEDLIAVSPLEEYLERLK